VAEREGIAAMDTWGNPMEAEEERSGRKGSQLHVKGARPCGGRRDERGLGRMDKRLWDKRRGDRRHSWGNPGESTSNGGGVECARGSRAEHISWVIFLVLGLEFRVCVLLISTEHHGVTT
jgi:hypothetical protein